MIRLVQCLCGPERHAIMAVCYETANVTPDDAVAGLKAYVEGLIERKELRRRCEICDRPVAQFLYEDHKMIEQDWDKAVVVVRKLEEAQAATQALLKMLRSGRNN